jgi:hypothetical protein
MSKAPIQRCQVEGGPPVKRTVRLEAHSATRELHVLEDKTYTRLRFVGLSAKSASAHTE